jgi:dimethylpropiothetin dethiomethylase
MEKRRREEQETTGEKSEKNKKRKQQQKASKKAKKDQPLSSHVLLSSLLSLWSTSSSPFARAASSLASPIISSSPAKTDPWLDPHGVRAPPPPLPANLSALPEELASALAAAWDSLSWKVPKKLSSDYEAKMASASTSSSATMKSAMLVGDATQWGAPVSSSECYVGLMNIDPGVAYPSHAHAAEELFHVLSGSATWSLRSLPSKVAPGEFRHHPPSTPHGVTTGDEALLCAYFWTGDLKGPYWYTGGPCELCEDCKDETEEE